MIDLFTRAFVHPLEYAGVSRVTTLTLAEHRIEESGIHTFIFTPARPLTWKAGQHALFTQPNRGVTGKKWRAFSVASAPHEGVIRIGTNIPDAPSDFKQKLLTLKPGDTIRMFGPFGEFHLSPKVKRVVGIAGGIGITPFRALITDAIARKDVTPITLIYSARERHTYKEEFEVWTKDHPSITILYTYTPDEVTTALNALITAHGNTAHYFISGAPGMIEAMTTACRKKNVKQSHIINDPFKGY